CILSFMRLTLAHIGNRLAATDPFEKLTQMWLERMGSFAETESVAYRSTEAMFEALTRTKKGGAQVLVLLDSRGKQMSSEEFAAWLGARRDAGVAHIVFAIGPASGWDEDARKQAGLLLSLSKMTLAHALARAVLAEQVYRASTILSGHPYHTGH
ncbi:MAG TPA: 23S rRNA (pseudouridine(1915)-N(3))-methyltransferase RlmH, partial [Terracidiphilus sp.]